MGDTRGAVYSRRLSSEYAKGCYYAHAPGLHEKASNSTTDGESLEVVGRRLVCAVVRRFFCPSLIRSSIKADGLAGENRHVLPRKYPRPQFTPVELYVFPHSLNHVSAIDRDLGRNQLRMLPPQVFADMTSLQKL